MKNNKINYVVVGAFVLFIMAATLVTVSVMTGRTAATDTYYTVYANVSGLKLGTRVMNEGYPVGEVKTIEPAWIDNKLRFRVILSIRQGWKIPDDSKTLVAASGILSAVVIEVRNGESTKFLLPGSEIPSGGAGNLFASMTDVADSITALTEQEIKPLLRTLNQAVQSFDVLLNDKGDAFMSELLKAAKSVSDKTPRITSDIETFAAQLNKITSDENVRNVDGILANFDTASTNLATLSHDIQESRRLVDSILKSLNQAVGENRPNVTKSIQALRFSLDSISRSITSITHNLDSAGRNVNEFTREIRQDPSVLLGGRKAEDGPGVP